MSDKGLKDATNCINNIRKSIRKKLGSSEVPQRAAASVIFKSKQLGNIVSTEAEIAWKKVAQTFQRKTKRRRLLDNVYTPLASGKIRKSPGNPKQILGRTPTRLYSPFGIETPQGSSTGTSSINGRILEKDLQTGGVRRSPRIQNLKNHAKAENTVFYRPTGRIQNDINAVRESLATMHVTANSFVRKSIRKQLELE